MLVRIRTTVRRIRITTIAQAIMLNTRPLTKRLHQAFVVDELEHDDEDDGSQDAVDRLAGEHGLHERLDREQNDGRAQDDERRIVCRKRAAASFHL